MSESRTVDRKTQCDLLRDYFDKGGSLTVLEAIQVLGCYALSQRCGELRRGGYPVTGEMVSVGKDKRVKRYSKEFRLEA